MSTEIQLRRDTAANFTSANPILASGEVGVETDNAGTGTALKYKIGDGTTRWTSLPYEGGGGAGGALLTTSGAPSSAVGALGDYAIDPTAKLLYGPKQNIATPGAFPSVAVLDTFNRSAENPLSNSGKWSTPIYTGDGALKIVASPANVAVPAGPTGEAYWNVSTFTDCDVYCDLAANGTDQEVLLYFRLSGFGGANPTTGYYVSFVPGGTSASLYNAHTIGVIGAPIPLGHTLADGDSIGVRMLGSVITPYYKPSGGSWTAASTTWTNSTFTSGYIGVGFNSSALTGAIDNFGGGTVSTSSSPGWLAGVSYNASSTGSGLLTNRVYASDYGVVGDGATDNWAALQGLMTTLKGLINTTPGGYRVILPSGYIQLSKALVVPSYVYLEGQGFYSTTLRIANGANCDVVQMEQYNSTYQAGLLGVTASALRNAFRAGISDLAIHGNAANQTYGTYAHGLNVTTNPTTSAGPGDPDFDPEHTFRNLYFRSCTGDGYFHSGRSGCRLIGCFAEYNNGNGFTFSFDTQIDHCQSGFNGIAGFYFNHQAVQGAGNKSYNNGAYNPVWVSGTAYSADQTVMYSGAQYVSKLAVTSSTPPSTDTTNWAAITATSPQAWGVGAYFDGNAGEITFNCDGQENSADNFYVTSTLGAIHLTGVSNRPNFNNTTGGGPANTTNPNHYAALTLNNAAGVIADIGANAMSPAAYMLRVLTGSTRNDVRMAGDTSAAATVSPDSITLSGSGNSIKVNAVTLA